MMDICFSQLSRLQIHHQDGGRFGFFRDLILGLQLATSSGPVSLVLLHILIAPSGGRQ